MKGDEEGNDNVDIDDNGGNMTIRKRTFGPATHRLNYNTLILYAGTSRATHYSAALYPPASRPSFF
jgi:hypothetical protein